MPLKTLIFVPTYNEKENAERMCTELLGMHLGADLLFLDDNSPDGTGELLDGLSREHPNVHVIHRSGKLGIGSAHQHGIGYAYDHKYDRLVTMDCDFTHSPADVLRLIECGAGYDVTIGSRFMQDESLPGWNVMRKLLTRMGHWLTTSLLRISFDATGALRVYDLRRLPREVFALATARGYAFFFESLFIISRNGFTIKELPIVLPARTYGHSKMSWTETIRSTRQLFTVWLADTVTPERFRLSGGAPLALDASLVDPQNWDPYWSSKMETHSFLYEMAAGIYRRMIIRRNLERAVSKYFPAGALLLHAGCGSGQVDESLHTSRQITAIDISPAALKLYAQNNPTAFRIQHASILSLPFADASFDGIYNLGVMEHFTRSEIIAILSEFHRVLRPNGTLLMFWPHRRATSVVVLRFVHWLLNRVLNKPTQLFPPEISLLASRKQITELLSDVRFLLSDYSFGPHDFFVQAVIVARKSA